MPRSKPASPPFCYEPHRSSLFSSRFGVFPLRPNLFFSVLKRNGFVEACPRNFQAGHDKQVHAVPVRASNDDGRLCQHHAQTRPRRGNRRHRRARITARRLNDRIPPSEPWLLRRRSPPPQYCRRTWPRWNFTRSRRARRGPSRGVRILWYPRRCRRPHRRSRTDRRNCVSCRGTFNRAGSAGLHITQPSGLAVVGELGGGRRMRGRAG